MDVSLMSDVEIKWSNARLESFAAFNSWLSLMQDGLA